MTKKAEGEEFMKIPVPRELLAELDESLAFYGWKKRAPFFREMLDRWLVAWRERKEEENAPGEPKTGPAL
jgi:metal-responsive CopG/Arc/MetJ family transcriptional regulator